MTWTWTLEFYLSLCIFTVSGNLLLPTCRQHVNANGTYPQLHVNATNPQLPRCATSIKNFRKGIHLRERSWSYENDDATSLLPPWTDISLAVKGQQFAIDRVQGIFQSYLYGVTLILANPQLRDTLLFTGNSDTVPKSSRRYAATVLQISLWIRRALSKESIKLAGHENWVLESISKVRRIHNQVGFLIQGALKNKTFAKYDSSSGKQIDTELWTAFEKDLTPFKDRDGQNPGSKCSILSSVHPQG
ncbi:uncharacterized protein LOC118437554 [Folsomia candida]|uniref:uncharacterized protein LOC118437554 n=1 Tax=Folsomia candida TaxID=158441 RepID=UPI0016054118|nr:uncharacterized protein LOC118437554 [Folsomia candida]